MFSFNSQHFRTNVYISIIYNFSSPSKENGSQEKKQKYVQYSQNKFNI